MLTALVDSFGGGPVGLSTLAVAVGEQPDTVEEVCEPFLVRAGLLARTPRGRVATEGAWRHLGPYSAERYIWDRRSASATGSICSVRAAPDLISRDRLRDLRRDSGVPRCRD